ncbi:unnamed protein product, partial [Polarella glacialis]
VGSHIIANIGRRSTPKWNPESQSSAQGLGSPQRDRAPAGFGRALSSDSEDLDAKAGASPVSWVGDILLSAKSQKWHLLNSIHSVHRARARAQDFWILSLRANLLIASVIVVQAFVIGYEVQIQLEATATDIEAREAGFYVPWVINIILNLFFWVEYILRVRALGWKYALRFAGIFDALLIVAGSVGVILSFVLVDAADSQSVQLLQCLRILRILRAARLVTIFPELELLANGLGSTVIAIFYAIFMIAILSYAGGLFCAELLGSSKTCASDGMCLQNLFNSVANSFLTHLKLVLLEAWPDIAAPMLIESRWWGLYVAAFICVANFALLNLVTGVVCDSIMELAHQMPPCSAEQKEAELTASKNTLVALFKRAHKEDGEHLSKVEYVRLLNTPQARAQLHEMKIALPTLQADLATLFDEDNNGKVNLLEWQNGLMRLRGSRGEILSRSIQHTNAECFREVLDNLVEADLRVQEHMQDSVKAMGWKLLKNLDEVTARLKIDNNLSAERKQVQERQAQEKAEQAREETQACAEVMQEMSELEALTRALRHSSKAAVGKAAIKAPAALLASPPQASVSIQTDPLELEPQPQEARGAEASQPPEVEMAEMAERPDEMAERPDEESEVPKPTASPPLPPAASERSPPMTPIWKTSNEDQQRTSLAPLTPIWKLSTRSQDHHDDFHRRLARGQLTE